MTRYYTSPLRAVVAALGIVAFIMTLFTIAFLLRTAAYGEDFFKYHCKRLAAFSSSVYTERRQPLRVIGVGTSLLRFATYYDKEMAAYAGTLGLPLSYLRNNGTIRRHS